MTTMMNDLFRRGPVRQAEGADGGTGGDATPPAGDATPPAGDTTPAAKWFENTVYSQEERAWLAARGMAEDDPLAALPKLIKGHRAAEQRIGKGLDTIIDRPAKDQPYDEWVAANREALGLPKDEAGYAVKPPEDWPKDLPWDTALETQAKAVALKYGIPPAALQELVTMQAKAVLDAHGAVTVQADSAKAALMTDLEKDWGTQTPAKITLAKQAAQAVAQKAGMDMTALANMSDMMMAKTGDANVIRFMAALGEMMGDDVAVGLGKGGSMTTTPAEARQQLANLRAEGGAYYKASKEGNRAAMAALQPQIDQLTRIAAG